MVISALRQKSKFEFRTFLEKNIKFLGSHGVVLVKAFPLMYQLLMKDWYWRSYGDFSCSSKVKIRISNFFGKNLNFGISMV